MTISKTETTPNTYKYYNASGVFIGKSEGHNPSDSLFRKAHYVISNDLEMIKNLDPQPTVKRDIQRYRDELLNVPLSNMGKIMELNHLIKNLERFLDAPRCSA